MEDIITLSGERLRWFEFKSWDRKTKYILLPVYN